MSNILFYDKNSIDGCLSAIINYSLFKFENYQIDSNEINIDNYSPNSNLNNKNNYFFVGCKPDSNWITTLLQTNSNCNIYIFYDNINNSDYLNFQNNVVTFQITSKLISKDFFNFVYNFQINNDENFDLNKKELVNKIKLIISDFNKFVNNFETETNPLQYDIFHVLKYLHILISFDEINIINICYLIEKSFYIGNIYSGILKESFNISYINEILSKSITADVIMKKTLLINCDKFESIDLQITKEMIENNDIWDFKLIEYYHIDENRNVIITIKKPELFLSILPINNETTLNEYIGIENKQEIIDYISARYDTNFILNKNGSFTCSTTIQTFFNI
jgi:hypothetical protein